MCSTSEMTTVSAQIDKYLPNLYFRTKIDATGWRQTNHSVLLTALVDDNV